MENDERKRAKGEMLEALIILKFPLALSWKMCFRLKKSIKNILKTYFHLRDFSEHIKLHSG